MRGRGIARSFGLRNTQSFQKRLEPVGCLIAAIPARLDVSIFVFFSQSMDYSKPADSDRGRLRLIAMEAVRVAETR
jgi:hypothetical protein